MIHARHRHVVLASATLLLMASALPFAGTQAAPSPQTTAPASPERPTAPPPGSPAPGSRCVGCGVAPEPADYGDRTGWTEIFNGSSLDGWDGNPAVWRVENGAIVAETWPDRRVGTTYLIWRGGEPSDFELKLEVKADYDVHSGVFYRSIVGPAPARSGGPAGGGAARGAGAPANGPARQGAPGPGATAGSAPVAPRAQQAPPAIPADPKWNVRGYSIDWDYDPGNDGHLQDTAGRAETQVVWRGHIVRLEAGKRPRSIGSLGDRDELMKLVRIGDWNQVHVIARGNQITHIVNGHVMAVLLDDDPGGFKSKGVIALQIEQFGMGKVHFRNIWLKQ